MFEEYHKPACLCLCVLFIIPVFTQFWMQHKSQAYNDIVMQKMISFTDLAQLHTDSIALHNFYNGNDLLRKKAKD